MLRSVIVAALVFFVGAGTAAEVTITVNNKLDYTFSAEPRIADVVNAINPEADWYWPAATLFTPVASATVEEVRNTLLNTLKKRLGYWQKRGQQQHIALLQDLINYVEAMKLATHIAVPLDPIGAGARVELNRRFTAGRYLLIVPEQRPDTIWLWGAVTAQNPSYIAAGAAADYRQQLQLGGEADNSFVYIVQPDRSIHKVGTAYWNRQQFEPLPGAQLIVPFSRKVLRSDTAGVNAQLLILAQNRVL